jgi:hypothetical protein
MQQQKDTSLRDAFIYMSVGLFMVGAIWGMIYFLNKVSPLPAKGSVTIEKPSPDKHKTVVLPRGGLIAATELDYKEMIDASYARDEAELMKMSRQGKVFTVSAYTKVKVLIEGSERSRIVVQDGDKANREGLIPNEYLR